RRAAPVMRERRAAALIRNGYSGVSLDVKQNPAIWRQIADRTCALPDSVDSGRRVDGQARLTSFGEAVVEVGDQFRTKPPTARLVPQVPPLMRIVLDVVELALRAVVADPARRQHPVAHRLLEPVRLPDGARLVRRQEPTVSIDRSQVHALA